MKAYTSKQYYVKERSYHGKSLGWGVFRDGSLISTFERLLQAEVHAEKLNGQFGDLEALNLLNDIRKEITLYEDGEFSAEDILGSVKGMLDSREKT
jgi:hypothetical protein